jgi:aminotransferase in exopolysaccharide biosynthesis
MKQIGLHEPFFIGNEKKYLIKCIDENWVSSSGRFLKLFQSKFKKITKGKFLSPVLNGTVGLHICMLQSGVKENDEVIVPTITFIATINSIKYVGASPIFMDVDEYLNIDEEKTIEFIKKKTIFKNGHTYNKITGNKIKALVVVHTFGNAARIDKIFEICRKRKIKLIEDAAESIGTKYNSGKFKNKHTGTIGDFGVFSLNGNKIITSGNGGLVISKNKKDSLKINYLISQSKDDKVNFIHNNVGYNYKLSNLSAAVGLAQLEKLNFFLERKKNIRNYYKKKIEKIKGVKILKSPKYSNNNNWLNLVQMSKKEKTKKIMKKLNLNGFQSRPIWYPNHLQRTFKKNYSYKIKRAQEYVKSIICLPSSANLKKKQMDKIVDLLK